MKSSVVLGLIVVSLLIPVLSFSQDLRKVTWGMTKAQVKATESSKPAEENASAVAYKTSVDGRKCFLVYTFCRHGLAQAGYKFEIEHANNNAFIDDYSAIKALLVQKYGEPLTSDVTWKNDLYKENPQDWGMSVAVGYTEFLSSWENQTTRVLLSLSGDNFEIALLAAYYSLELWDEFREETDAANSAEL